MKLASIEKILEVTHHPNADSLDLVKVLGYQAIVNRDRWKVGDICIFIQPDTVLPDAEWSKFYKEKSNRVKAIRLRGEWSFGIVESFLILPEDVRDNQDLNEGDEISDILDIIKYEPPAIQERNVKGGLPHGIPKTDEERFQNLNMPKYYGKTVDITLKVDGQSFTTYYVRKAGHEEQPEFGVCSRGLNYKFEGDNNFLRNVERYSLREKLAHYCEKYGVDIALRGEQYGANIQQFQHNVHSRMPLGLMFYSSYDIANKRYFNPDEEHYYTKICDELNLPTVPLLDQQIQLTPDLLEAYQNTNLYNGHPFEGVVVKGEDFSFKIINLNYDSKK